MHVCDITRPFSCDGLTSINTSDVKVLIHFITLTSSQGTDRSLLMRQDALLLRTITRDHIDMTTHSTTFGELVGVTVLVAAEFLSVGGKA